MCSSCVYYMAFSEGRGNNYVFSGIGETESEGAKLLESTGGEIT